MLTSSLTVARAARPQLPNSIAMSAFHQQRTFRDLLRRALQVGAFRQRKRVSNVNAKVTHGAVQLGMAEQDLDRTYVPGLAVYKRNLSPAERVRSVAGRLNPDILKPCL
jgi:hypothetical protein